MRRILVVGGTGFFGRAAVELLRARGLSPVVAARGGRANLRLDAEEPASLRSALRPGDIVIDAAGPFQERSAALVEAAAEIGCDVIDISDSIDHIRQVEALRPRIEAARIRVLTSCSTVTTLATALVQASGAADPVRISVCLAPASRETARAGTSGSLLRSLGRPIRVFRAGRRAIGRIRLRGGTSVARLLGSTAGGMLVEIGGADGSVTEARAYARRRSYRAAVAPAILAACDLVSGRGPAPGLVPHDRHVELSRLIGLLRETGIEVETS